MHRERDRGVSPCLCRQVQRGGAARVDRLRLHPDPGQRYITSITELDADPGVTEAASTLTEQLYPAIMEWQQEACAERARQRIAMGDNDVTCKLGAGAETRSL